MKRYIMQDENQGVNKRNDKQLETYREEGNKDKKWNTVNKWLRNIVDQQIQKCENEHNTVNKIEMDTYTNVKINS